MMLEVPNMKINRFLAGMLLGATLMLTGLLLSYLGHDAFFLVAGGGAALATALVRRWQTGDQPERDERTNKIRAFGLRQTIKIDPHFSADGKGLHLVKV